MSGSISNEAQHRKEPHRPRIWLRFILAVAVIVLIGAAAIAYWWFSLPTVESVEKMIDENLPPGSSAEEILAFLDSRDVYHTPVERAYPYYSDDPSSDDLAIWTKIDRARGSLICNVRIRTTFILDKEGRLKSYEVSEASICP